jgi:TolA-binding protein
MGLLVQSVQGMPPEDRRRFADGLYVRGLYELAAEEYTQLLEQAPEGADRDMMLFRLGECHRQAGQATAAESAYARVVSQFPESPYRFRALLRRAEIARQGGRLQEAAALLKGLLRKTLPEDIQPAVRYELACTYADMDRAEDAEDLFRELMNESGESPFASLGAMELAALYQARHADPDTMLALYRKAAEQPASRRMAVEAWLRLASAASEQKRYGEAVEAYDNLRLHRKETFARPAVRLQAAWAYYRNGRYADALEVLHMEDMPVQPEWLYIEANCRRRLLQAERALEVYDRLLEQFPNASVADAARYERALLLYAEQQYDAILDDAEVLTTLPDADENLYWLLAEACAARENVDSAIQYYRLIMEKFPEGTRAPYAVYRLARLLRARNETASAVAMYQQLLERYPASDLAPQTLLETAVCLSEQDDYAGAVREWTRLLEMYPDSPLREQALYHKAMGELRLERDRSALRTLQEFVKNYPASDAVVDAGYWRGWLYEKQQQWADAEAAYREALEQASTFRRRERIRVRLAGVLRRNGHPAEAANMLQTLLSGSVTNAVSTAQLLWLGQYRLEQQAWSNAQQTAEVLIADAADPGVRQQGYVMLGDAMAGRGQSVEARKAFADAMAYDLPGRARAYAAWRRGELALEAQELQQAQAAFRKAAEWAVGASLMAIRARSYRGLGMAAKEMGNDDDAVRYLLGTGVLFDDPQLVPECLFLAAEILRQQGREQQALQTEAELRERYPDSPWISRLDDKHEE